MHAFRKTLEAFCQNVLGMKLDTTKMLELESSTPKKFSRHVIVKALGEYPNGPDGDGVQRALAFANNAQTGLLVNHLVKYAEAHRDESWSLSRYLFVEAPGRDVEQQRQVCVIDESVYSRNRSFRLLFQSKFGKDRRLDLDHSRDDDIFGGKPYPAIALVQTMASFVPEGTELFRHQLIPSDYGHAQAVISRISRGRKKKVCTANSGGFENHFPHFSMAQSHGTNPRCQVVLWVFAVRMARFLRLNVIRC